MEHLKPIDFKAVAAKGYYLYVYLRESDLSPYYVGLTKGHRRPVDPRHCAAVPEDVCRIRVLRSGLSKEQAEAWERFYIFWYGRIQEGGILENTRLGGSTGSTGYRHTVEAKASFALRVWSDEVNDKRRKALHNRPLEPKRAAALAKRNKENAKKRTANSSRNRRINTAKRLNVCPLLWGTLSKTEMTKARMRVHRGATGAAVFECFFAAA